MSAHADDLRHFYSETLGISQTVAADAVGAKKTTALEKGRYLVQFHTLAGGVNIVWCRQGPQASVLAAAAAPSTPMEVGTPPRPTLTLMVSSNKPIEGDDGLSFLCDAGTCSVTVTKISRGKN
jgi:hypothetical protein